MDLSEIELQTAGNKKYQIYLHFLYVCKFFRLFNTLITEKVLN